mmetsp:Transcript_35199/g.75169  ORF Transcript_35199/g.75169 Transcript_35199/m.75169 type:complete len:205 (+) Transcript_35199:302-916(+)
MAKKCAHHSCQRQRITTTFTTPMLSTASCSPASSLSHASHISSAKRQRSVASFVSTRAEDCASDFFAAEARDFTDALIALARFCSPESPVTSSVSSASRLASGGTLSAPITSEKRLFCTSGTSSLTAARAGSSGLLVSPNPRCVSRSSTARSSSNESYALNSFLNSRQTSSRPSATTSQVSAILPVGRMGEGSKAGIAMLAPSP